MTYLIDCPSLLHKEHKYTLRDENPPSRTFINAFKVGTVSPFTQYNLPPLAWNVLSKQLRLSIKNLILRNVASSEPEKIRLWYIQGVRIFCIITICSKTASSEITRHCIAIYLLSYVLQLSRFWFLLTLYLNSNTPGKPHSSSCDITKFNIFYIILLGHYYKLSTKPSRQSISTRIMAYLPVMAGN